jgi:Yip1 domain
VINRTYIYIVFAAGILLVVAALLKVPVGFGPGAALCALGIALFGLSFVPRGEEISDAPAPMSFFDKLTGIFFEPSAVFRNLRAHPRWLFALLLTTLLSFAYATAFTYRLTPERIVSFTTDKVVERFNIPAEQAQQMKTQQIEEAKSPTRTAGRAVTTFVGAFFVTALLAALYMVAVLLFGGRLGFWQAFSVLAWASVPVVIIGRVLSLVLLYVKDPDDIHPLLGQGTLVTDNLGALVKAAEHPVLFTVLSFFGVLSFYGLWLVATGLRNAGTRVKPSTAWTIAIIFWLIAMLMAAGVSALFGNFIS